MPKRPRRCWRSAHRWQSRGRVATPCRSRADYRARVLANFGFRTCRDGRASSRPELAQAVELALPVAKPSRRCARTAMCRASSGATITVAQLTRGRQSVANERGEEHGSRGARRVEGRAGGHEDRIAAVLDRQPLEDACGNELVRDRFDLGREQAPRAPRAGARALGGRRAVGSR